LLRIFIERSEPFSDGSERDCQFIDINTSGCRLCLQFAARSTRGAGRGRSLDARDLDWTIIVCSAVITCDPEPLPGCRRASAMPGWR
jgi:hypothetical protein